MNHLKLTSYFKKRFQTSQDATSATSSHLKNSDIVKAAQIFRINFQKMLKLAGRKKRHQKWILLIGPKGSGKTQWLNQAGLHSVQSITNAGENSRLNLTEEAVIFDMPGEYFDKKYSGIWPEIASAIKHQRGHSLDAVILHLNLPQCVQQTRDEQILLIQQIKEALNAFQLNNANKTLPVYIIFNQIDRISGFQEFFSALNETARSHIWGIDLPPYTNADALSDFFSNDYLKIIEQLNMHVVSYMHRERLAEKRARIRDFPLQMETLKAPIAQFLHALWEENNNFSKQRYRVKGIYFCSAQQEGNIIDRLAKPIQQYNITVNENFHLFQFTQHKSYFIQELLKHILAQPDHIEKLSWIQQTAYRLPPKYTYALAASIAVLGFASIAYFFNIRLQHLSLADNILQRYQFLNQQITENSDDVNLLQVTNALDTLARAVDQLKNQSKKLKLNTLQAYVHATQNKFLPLMMHYLEKRIEPIIENPSTDLYRLLKTYLMFSHLNYMQTEYVTNTLVTLWSKDPDINPDLLSKLEKHLRVALKNQTVPLPLKNEMVQEARKTLTGLPYSLLGYLILKTQVETSTTPIISAQNNHSLVFNQANSQLVIPAIYTKKQFSNVYNEYIPELSKTLKAGNWVLGKNNNAKPVNEQELIEQMRSFYLSDYVNWWNLLLLKTQLVNFDNLKQADEAFAILASSQSPLLNILQAIMENTSKRDDNDKLADIFNNSVAEKFNQINDFFKSPQQRQNFLKEIQTHLKNVRNYIHGIAASNNPDAAAFEIAKNKLNSSISTGTTTHEDPFIAFENMGQNAPEPVRSWANSIVQNTWQLILIHAQKHINYKWAQEVLPEYQHNIENHYPVFKQSQQEISLENFVHFFGPAGTLNRFVTEYLQPFINVNTPQWQPKIMYGAMLNVSAEILQQLERAYIIQKMFFPKNKNEIAVNFSLQPISFEPVVKKMSLTVNGQLLEDEQGENTISNFNWPGAKKAPSLVQLEFNNIDGQYSTITTDGAWAWFRLLDRSNIQTNPSDPRNFYVYFDLNGNATQYQLNAQEMINPFMPNILNQFRAPAEIG